MRKHELERNLAERERWFSTTLASLGDAVIATDPDERVTFMNPVAQTITSVSLEDAKGRRLEDVLRLVSDDGAVVRPLRNALRDRTAVSPGGTRSVDRHGDDRLIEHTAAPIVDDRGALLGGVVVFRDVTAEKKLERRVEIAERLASLGTMAAGIAHEMNNPLAAVMGNVSVALQDLRSIPQSALVQNPVAEHIDRCIAALVDAVTGSERLRKIVATMRWFVGERSTESQVLGIEEILEPALRLTRNPIYHKARLVRAYGTTPLVEVDEGQMVQVFVNLLSNAADAIAEGNATGNEIRVSSHTDEAGRAVVEIRDTGAGIRPSDVGKIFDPFFSTKGVGGGMGLGLSISHSFVAAAGGEMEVDSQPGRGTAVRVKLPPATRDRAERASRTPQQVSARRRVLVIDDEPSVAKVIQRMLPEHDIVVENDAGTALARITAGERYDVVLCDVMMPVMSGMDLYESMRSSHPEMASKVVFLTGGAFSPRASEFLERVKNEIVTKPFTAAQLRAAIGRVVA